MGFQRAAVLQRLVTEGIKHLCIDHRRYEVKGRIRVGHDAEQRRFPVPQFIQFQLVIHHHVPDFLDVKRGHPCTAGNKYAFRRLACRHLVFFILADSEMFRVALLQAVKHHIHGVFKVFIILPNFGSVQHFQQGI